MGVKVKVGYERVKRVNEKLSKSYIQVFLGYF
jgi:hypothetical protein